MNNEERSFLIDLVRSAGREIMQIYDSQSYTVEEKADSSPITDADKASHELIVTALKKRFSFPILSEEDPIEYSERKEWTRFWLLDPLDGTKDFIERTGDFTVNLALIENSCPIVGLVGVPSNARVYYAEKDYGAFCYGDTKEPKKLQREPMLGRATRCVESRFHSSEAVLEFKKVHNITESVHCGSAIKFCSIAEGLADVYPRLSPTSEWDTAAGQLLAELAGAEVLDVNTGKPLRYNKESTLNPGFIVKDVDFELLSGLRCVSK